MMCCALALPALVLFSSCKKDDDAKTLAQSIEGTYPVDIRASLKGTPSADDEPMDASVAITAASSNSVNLNLIGFQFNQKEIPISLTNVSVTGSEGNTSLNYDGAIISEALEAMTIRNTTGTLSGTIQSGVMDLLFKIEARANASDENPYMTVWVTLDSK